MLGAFSICSFAQQENQSINYNFTVDGENHFGGEIELKQGASVDFEIIDITVNGQPVEPSKISYKWEKSCPAPAGMPGLIFEEIDGANESSYSISSYDGTLRYRCTVTVDGVGYRCREVWLKEDTLTVAGHSNKPFVFNEEDENYYINDLEVGEEVTLTIDATSTLQGATIEYEWTGGDAYIQPDSELDEGSGLGNTTNTLTVTKKVGQQNYFCMISDGQVTRWVHFMLMSKETITDSIVVNGEHPGTYAGTYVYVTEPDSSVTISIPSTSTNGDIEYKWYYDTEGYNTPVRIDNTADSITITKSKMTQENPYAWEVYRCYLEDGNDRIRYWIMLFCLDPETPLSEINKIGEETPDIEIKTKSEDLANTVLNGDELMALSQGAPIEVTLSAELKQTVSQAEKKAIDEELNQNSNVGLYLDINLYKDFVGEVSKVSELHKSIEISVDMPEDLINKNDGVEREFSVVRVHNGVAEIIPCRYNESTNKIDFSTDRFSTYTVVYTDTEIKSPTGSNSGIAEDKIPQQEPQPSDKKDELKVESPDTGDNSVITLWLVLAMVSGAAVVILLKIKKEKQF